MGEGTGARAGYRNCLYGHDIKHSCATRDLASSNKYGLIVTLNGILLARLVTVESATNAYLNNC